MTDEQNTQGSDGVVYHPNERALELIKHTAWQVSMYYAQLLCNGISEDLAKELTVAFQKALIGGSA